MGHVIKSGASTAKVVTDVRATLARAAVRDPEILADAQRYLGTVEERARVLDAEVDATTEQVVQVRAEVQEMDLRCNDLVGQVRDRLWNQIGRTANDPVFGECFPGGTQKYVRSAPRRKAASLDLLATMLETHRHRLIDDALVAEVTTQLRDQAAVMKDVWDRYDPLLTRMELLRAQRTSNGRRARQKLVALKKFWQGEGMSEPDIHMLIPNRKPSGVSVPEPEAAEEYDLDVQDDLLEVIDDVEDDVDLFTEDEQDLAAK